MESALYVGRISHRRYLPKNHGFSYPFFMYFLDLDEVENHTDIGWLFSTKNWALSRFLRSDYYGEEAKPLHLAIKERMAELTGEQVQGKVFGLLNMRTLGLYFSPVNFYYGYDIEGNLTHFLAEVSNIPWNERHQYAYCVKDGAYSPDDNKKFKVSPFNPIDQKYSWSIAPPGEDLVVQLRVNDDRGKVFQASLNLQKKTLTRETLGKHILRKPVMTASIVAGIYWQALRLYLKKVPYIPYHKETI